MNRLKNCNGSSSRITGAALIAALLVALVYGALAWKLAPLEGFWSGDAGVKLWQMEAWIANGWRTPWTSYAQSNLALDPDHEWAPLGPPFAVWEGDRVLTIYTLPYMLGSSVLLAIGGRQALLIPSLLAGIAGLALAAWQGARFSPRVAWLAAPVLGLATPWLFYSITFWGHTLASVLVWSALALVLRAGHREASGWIAGLAAGLLLGAAIAVRPEALVCALASLVVLSARRTTRRSAGWVVLGLGVALLVGFFYQTQVVHQAIGGQVTMNFEPGAFESPLWSARRLFEMSQMVIESRHLGVLIVCAGGALVLELAYAYRRLRRSAWAPLAQVLEVLGFVLVALGAVVLLARGHEPVDLVMGAPVVCLLVIHLSGTPATAGSRSGSAAQLLAWCGVVVALSVALGRQNGGLQWGPRYLTPVLGPLVVLSLARWEELDRAAGAGSGRRGLCIAIACLVLAGVATQAVGVVRLHQVQAANGALTQALLEEPPAVVVTDVWFVPQIAPAVYGRLPFLLVRTAEEWEEVDRRLEAQGVERLRVVRLPDQETVLTTAVSAHWSPVEGSGLELATVPPLRVIDFVRSGYD